MIHLSATPVLETERLILRAPVATDYPAYVEFMASERSRFVAGPLTEAETWGKFSRFIGHWVMRGYGLFIITDRQSGAALGHVGPIFPAGRPEPEISWAIWAPDAEGRGVMFEAAEAVRNYVFTTLELETAVSYVARDNPRSAALAQRLGAAIDPDAIDPDLGVVLDVYRHPRRTA